MGWGREWNKVNGFQFKETIYEKKYFKMGGVSRITMARSNPKGLNTISLSGQLEMIAALRDARLDDSIGVVVIQGIGDKSFCVGGDLNEEKKDSRRAMEESPDPELHIRLVGKPVIAAVKGYCIGYGNHFAYHCDFTIAADNAIFGQTGPKVGSPAGGALVSYLSRVIGPKKAREMWMLCRRYNAQEALQMGLINVVVPLEKFENEIDKWCIEILEKNPTCIKIIKASFDSEIEQIPHGGGYFPNLIAPYFFGGQEQLEAMEAFLEKRKPDWGKICRKRPKDFVKGED
ncbi:MAG: enoyl-CoA hydratase/isomerase family protein [Deltaproteobacteria bacterium]|nr:enoyl-CoA hydratase/isomerase family protein [Deltaproteobacteria bacterium]